ncbi:MAG: lipoate--protein ligase family protein [Alphaproteobacteria bacterium]|nr:lipoate--protein ligase family protein [Alphaproteobacteria bacterium]
MIPGVVAFGDALAMERAMLDGLANPAEVRDEQVVLAAIWQTERAIILPSGMSRRDGVAEAARRCAAAGWPVHDRATGGDVTPQFDGVLNISLGFVLSGTDRNIKAAYERLTAPLIGFLKREFGIVAYTSSVDGAFCDGAYNLVVGGRKLAGTAQRWKAIKALHDAEPQETAVLAHAAVLLGGELDAALTAANEFFAAWGSERRINPSAHVTIAELAGGQAGEPHSFARSLAAFLSKELGARAPSQS